MSGQGSFGKGESEHEGGTPDEVEELMMQMARQFEGETRGLRQDFISQLQTALSGDINTATRVPIIQMAMDASRRAGSQAMQETENEMARTGLAGTPFGEQIKATTAQNAAFSRNQIPSQFLAALQAMIPNFVLGQAQTAMAPLGDITYDTSQSKNWQTGGGGGVGYMGGNS